jgi:hypothetical protein
MRFGKIARAQQSRFRETLAESARTPTDPPATRHGHLLALGHGHYNLMPELRGPGGALSVFSSRGIKWWRSASSGDAPGIDGPTRNLASSQVACVNFLLPLARRPHALLAFLQVIDPSVVGIEPIPSREGLAPSLVEFEWVGWDQSLEGGKITRGAMQTSADAVVVGRTAHGCRAFVFEWKYCEEYRSPTDKGAGRSGVTRRSRYASRYAAEDSSFTGDIPIDDFLFEPFYQLMRLRLMADEMCRNGVTPTLVVTDARVVAVCPGANKDYFVPVARIPLAQRYPEQASIDAVMQSTLRDPAGIKVAFCEELVDALRASPMAPDLADWLDYHAVRYGW